LRAEDFLNLQTIGAEDFVYFVESLVHLFYLHCFLIKQIAFGLAQGMYLVL